MVSEAFSGAAAGVVSAASSAAPQPDARSARARTQAKENETHRRQYAAASRFRHIESSVCSPRSGTAPTAGRTPSTRNGVADRRNPARGRVDLGDETARGHLRMREHVRDVVHRAVRDARGREPLLPLGGGALAERLRQDRLELVAHLDALLVRRVALVVEELRPFEHVGAEHAPVLRGEDGDRHEPSVRRREGAVRAEERMPQPRARGQLAGDATTGAGSSRASRARRRRARPARALPPRSVPCARARPAWRSPRTTPSRGRRPRRRAAPAPPACP